MNEQSEAVFAVLDRDIALQIWSNLYLKTDLTERQLEAIQEALSQALAQPLKSTRDSLGPKAPQPK